MRTYDRYCVAAGVADAASAFSPAHTDTQYGGLVFRPGCVFGDDDDELMLNVLRCHETY